MDYKILPLHTFSDERGSLVALESCKNVPFEIKRVYYIFDTSPNLIEADTHIRILSSLCYA